MVKIGTIKKRDGTEVAFDKLKIVEAIWRAQRAVGERDRKGAEQIADEVTQRLEERGGIPSVEDVQDLVERVLIEKEKVKVSKAFILYRQKRTEIREEKKKILNKGVIDEVDKTFDLNSLRVLVSRYLKKDEKGHVIETLKELFTRVAVHVGLPDVLYDPKVYKKDGGNKPFPTEQYEVTKIEGFYIGKYQLNGFHLKALKQLYDRMNALGCVNVSWSKLLDMLQGREFDHIADSIDKYYYLMVSRKFLPNTPALANFGSYLGMGSACFVLDIDDSLDSIMETLKNAAIIFKAGGGVGYNFSKLRPEGDFVKTTSGVASGPVSFMKLFDTMTDVIKQGGIRRGANMGILNINHPDIEKFIKAKEGNSALKNFNISILVYPEFWDAYEKNEPYPLVNPRNGQVTKYINPRQLFDMIVYQAWESAEPGLIFYDTVNKHNPTLNALGPIVTTNPCGEVLLYPNESCNLGSINVWSYVQETGDTSVKYNWDALKDDLEIAVRFLDNVIDINKYPIKDIETATLYTRKVGLGVMGLADLLYELKLGYNADDGRLFMEQLAEYINYYSKVASIKLAEERGPFPLFESSLYKKGELPFDGFYNKESWHFRWDELAARIQQKGLRNAYTVIIAPTGSISMIAGVSSGMEPVYSLVYEKNITIGSFYYVDPVFEKVLKDEGMYSNELLRDITNNGGSIRPIAYISDDMKRVFVTAMDIKPEDHVRAQGVFQKWVDSSISKTINMPAQATVNDVESVYKLAYKLGAKDITVFRDKSITSQVYITPTNREEDPAVVADSPPVASTDQAIFKCPVCNTDLVYKEGCATCPVCGWSVCATA
ncbi:MAG: adenosylcobalamin-dependent ribonucleoside-diphosphate reductase [Nitrososphaerota archaeon]|nr:adenosylcobalamin-dependent ribonucleoside-diphosphate reductase [Nitrososphaerota archaeon]MDG7048790.1 adenosylcobalamin-dependent ribonucleoside-diphosphate reductase [Nitrososphaerota archaeon]MDG7050966.1 adenosylcobalamin-dependent ribonucleoside-diphosphate reductase [Nitrososphaerota archaeon]